MRPHENIEGGNSSMAFQNTRPSIAREDFEYAQEVIRKLSDYYSSKVVGQNTLRISMTAAIIADGHILIESVPGLAKTTAAKAVSDAVDGKFSRVQCTPDLLPSDIIGTQIYHQETGKFETIFGPVFANFVLLDEVNRSSAKTQSAMLEAMQERQVTIGGITYKMPQDIFIVIATQNPIEQEGTYPLPEAQCDRFMLKVKIDYPKKEEEMKIVANHLIGMKTDLDPVMSSAEILEARKIVKQVYIDEKIQKYIIDIVFATRYPETYGMESLKDMIAYGASPRASINLALAARAFAFLKHRGYVIPEDVRAICPDVMRHRIGLSYEAEANNLTTEEVIAEILNKVEVP
jgi:MoxR-like ATPase